MSENVLILHGLGGSGPEHWQTWLAARLHDRGVSVSYPDLPEPDAPKLIPWLEALTAAVSRSGPDGLVVVCHSLAAVAWLHLASRSEGRLADRVLLVAPPSAGAGVEEISEFFPAPFEPEAVARTAAETRVVCSATGDPYRPEGPELFAPLGVPIDVIADGGHLNTDAGYGPWPAVERWCLDASRVPIEGATSA